MGVNDAKQSERENKKNAAGAARRRRANVGSGGNAADWAGVDGTLLAKAVAGVARLGGALRFGYTRDGGAYAIGFYEGDDKWTEYIPPGDDVEEYLKGIIEDYQK